MTFRNAWVESVDGARRRLPGWAALVLAAATLAVALFGGGAIYRLLPGPAEGAYWPTALDRLLQDVCIIGPLYVVALLSARLFEIRPGRKGGIAPAVAGGLGVVSGIAFFLVALGLAALLGSVGPGADAPSHQVLGVLLGAVLVLFQAGGEEVFFRGWLQPVLAARWGPWIGLVVTSILFAVSHGLLQHLQPVALLNDFLAGMAFGLLALRTGGLMAAVTAHWGWNWTEQSLVGATPNPGVDPLGSLFNLDLKGSPLISGGVDEMNGSVCATVALLGLIALALLLPAPRRA